MSKGTGIIIIAIAVGLFSNPAGAYLALNDGASYTIDYDVYGQTWENDVWVDYQRGGTSTRVELVTGGYIDGDLRGFEDSIITVSGGRIGDTLQGVGNSQITLSGGRVDDYVAPQENTYMTISGGTIGEHVWVAGDSYVHISGGKIGWGLYVHENSQVTMSGGEIRNGLSVDGNSQMTISGGTIVGGVSVGYWYGEHTALITVEGVGFAIDGAPVGYGSFASSYAVSGSDPDGHSCLTGTLTGTLANGDALNDSFYIFDDADITFAVPEPATLLLLGCGGLALRRKRRL